MRFGEYLLRMGIIHEQDIREVLALQRYRKRKLGRLLVELGKLTPSDLDVLLRQYLKPLCELGFQELKIRASKIKTNESDQKFFRSKNIVPIELTDGEITIIGCVFADALIEEIEDRFKRSVTFAVVEPHLLDLVARTPTTKTITTKHLITVTQTVHDDDKLTEDNPYTKLLWECVKAAKDLGASDIHFEPFDLEYFIRFRTHGQLNDWKRLTIDHVQPLTARLKHLVNMDLAVVGMPQDSRAGFHTLGIDVRASSMPVSSGGEKIVLRLQYRDKKLDIRDLGLSDAKLQVLLDSIGKSDGLILISGPTGSGKTTTLYALLEEMDRLGKNISTLENPVEKQLPRINQADISDHRDFASFQRALMRQDPDVILLGEIRDAQTADLSMKLSSTGHLVLSTIHANGAVEVVDRLASLGVDSFSVRSNLRLSVAQRLLRTICPHCSRVAPFALKRKFGTLESEDFRITNLDGCKHCYKGVTGRRAVIEFLGREEINKMGNSTPCVSSSLFDECLDLAKSGLIDIRDALHYA
ncbi:MAG: Flp pilus assembly complex ATPase component TadA [Deltaproteobacteria bacterium]|nr:Flp pilus assembly complex ATPase component TadA [Deltaproteobacteria bacterium]